MHIEQDSIQPRIYSVTELTRNIKTLLEESFPIIWISGEISNMGRPASGHFYFTIKDSSAQISAVMFRGQNQKLSFLPENGMNITGLGRISVYEPRGTYQIIIEHLEPKGIGALQIEFEQLKSRLSQEGIFDEKYKKPIPFLPKKIVIVTSPTGAVIHDIINIISRRFPDIHINILPVKVQGKDADNEIAQGIETANNLKNSDVIILARGGGSLEDLNAFNSETVARAIFASEIPVVSAIGHETDYTIADFVADLRAPTPSAAAEIVVPVKSDLEIRAVELQHLLINRFKLFLGQQRKQFDGLNKRLIDPRKKIEDLILKTDDFTNRLIRVFNNRLDGKRKNLHSLEARLNALNPTSILNRGYSITRTIPDLVVVRDASLITLEQDIEVRLAKGTLTCRVKGKSSDGKKNI